MTLTPIDRGMAHRAAERAAGSYDAGAALQREVEARLFERLEFFPLEPRRIIDLGCGTGGGSQQLARQFPGSTVLALDWSPAMLGRHRHRPHGDKAALAVCADMSAIPVAARSIDLVFSSLAVPCSADEPAVFAAVRRVLRPGGLFLFSSFGPDTLYELRAAWSRVDDDVHVHRFADMHDVGDALVRAGFRDPVMDTESLVLEYPDPASVMRELKAVGATNAASARARGLRTPRQQERVEAAYAEFVRDGRCPARYEIIFGAARGPEEGQPVREGAGEIATFSVDALRRTR